MKRVLTGLIYSAGAATGFVGGVMGAYLAFSATSFVGVALGVFVTLIYGFLTLICADAAGGGRI